MSARPAPTSWIDWRCPPDGAGGGRRSSGALDGLHPGAVATDHVGDVDEARSLIDAGVDVNAKDDDHEIAWVPLLLASRSGHAPVVQLLLERGADVNAKSNSEQTAVSCIIVLFVLLCLC